MRNLGGDWISAIPIPGSFVCNIGDMLKVLVLPNCYLSFLNITFWEPFGESYMQILSNGLYESTLHRVINNSPLYRVCVAFFYEVAKLSSTLLCVFLRSLHVEIGNFMFVNLVLNRLISMRWWSHLIYVKISTLKGEENHKFSKELSMESIWWAKSRQTLQCNAT